MTKRSLVLVGLAWGAVLLPALLAAGAASCAVGACGPLGPGAGDEPSEPVLGEPFELEAGAQVTLAEAGLRIEFLQVSEDSRCPVDVNCVWEGDATVGLGLSHPHAEPAEVELHTSRNFATEASYAGLRIELLELRPQPRSDSRIEAGDYVARLLVRRQPDPEA